MEPYMSQIQAFGFDFAPQGWATCSGQAMAIAQNQALFSLLGTTYGGNGITTFNLPDLRGRTIRHYGTGPGLPNIPLGQVGGTETVTLNTSNIPAHTHNVAVGVITTDGNGSDPKTRLAACANTYTEAAGGGVLGGVTEATVGQNQPMQIREPFLVVNICIATQGIFPSRN